MIMQVLQICDAMKEPAEATPEKKPAAANGRDCNVPFTFSRLVQYADMGSFASPVELKNIAVRGNYKFLA